MYGDPLQLPPVRDGMTCEMIREWAREGRVDVRVVKTNMRHANDKHYAHVMECLARGMLSEEQYAYLQQRVIGEGVEPADMEAVHLFYRVERVRDWNASMVISAGRMSEMREIEAGKCPGSTFRVL